jgi:hypothetical protein
LRGAGWKQMAITAPGTWNRCGRERQWQAIYGQVKIRWEMSA